MSTEPPDDPPEVGSEHPGERVRPVIVLRPRELIFGGLAAILLLTYLLLGVRVAPAVSLSGTPTPTPTLASGPIQAPKVIPGTIAFVIRGDVFVMRGGSYRAQTSEGRALQPSLSADGAQVVFARSESVDGRRVVDGQVTSASLGFTNIIRKPAGGGSEEMLLSGLTRAGNGFHEVSWLLGPALSTSGRQLAFVEDSGDGTGNSELEVLDLQTRRIATLSSGSRLADPAWSPDGKTIVVTTYTSQNEPPGLLLVTADGKSATRVKIPEGDAYAPSFSRDGKWLVYTLRTGKSNDVHAVELATARDIALTTGGASWHGVFSPDGASVAFLREEKQVIDLWTMELGEALAGGAPKAPMKLTHGEGVNGEDRPSWGS
ncbi:MAG: TolB family protein [Candidatus Limnocylindria bacterium]